MLNRSTVSAYKDSPILDAPAALAVSIIAVQSCHLVHGVAGPDDPVAVVMGATDPSEALSVVVSGLGVDTTAKPLRASVYPAASKVTVCEWLGKDTVPFPPSGSPFNLNLPDNETFATEQGRANIADVMRGNEGALGVVSKDGPYPQTTRHVTIEGLEPSPLTVIVTGADSDAQATNEALRALQSRGVSLKGVTATSVSQTPDVNEELLLKAPRKAPEGIPVSEPAPAGVVNQETKLEPVGFNAKGEVVPLSEIAPSPSPSPVANDDPTSVGTETPKDEPKPEATDSAK